MFDRALAPASSRSRAPFALAPARDSSRAHRGRSSPSRGRVVRCVLALTSGASPSDVAASTAARVTCASARASGSRGAVGRTRAPGSGRRRGALAVTHGLVKPRGMSDQEFEQMLRQQDEQYKLFSEKAKRRIAKKGPMEGDVKGTSEYVSTQSLGAPVDEEPNWQAFEKMTIHDFIEAVDRGQVKSFQVWDAPQFGWFPPKEYRKIPRARHYLVTMKGEEGKKYYVDAMNQFLDKAMLDKCDRMGAWYTYHQKWKPSTYSGMEFLAYSLGGLAFMIGSIYLGIIRKTSVPQDQFQAMQFAQSRAGARRDGTVNVTLEDVGGLENIIEDLEEVVAFLKEPERFAKVGARPPKGLLMEGGPGVGKTLIAKAIAGEAKVPFYSMSGSEFVEIIVGVGAARVRDLFKRARINAPCLIFVDEIDALGTKRAAAGTRGTEEHEQTLNQLLTEMDGFTPDTGVVFIGATNRADLLDPALLRPGRFDRKVRVELPTVEARAKILQIHLSKRNCNPEIDTKRLAQNLPGLSGAEIANICNEAAVHCVRRGGEQIEENDVLDAVERVVSGIRLSPHPKDALLTRKLATHEVGHALVQNLLHKHTGLIENIELISIIPRGFEPTMTLIQRKRDEDYQYPTRARYCERVQVLLAGRVCEQVMFGEATTRGTEDIVEANDLLRNMIVNFGLGQPGMLTTYTHNPALLNRSEKRLARLQGVVSKSGEINRLDDLKLIAGPIRAAAPDHYQYAERKILQILQEAEENCRAMLTAHAAAINVMVDRLIEQETLSLAELEEILAENPPTGDYPKVGPDTPVKLLPTEAVEELMGVRTIKDPDEKVKAAAKLFNVSVADDELKIRDPEKWKKVPSSLTDYLAPYGNADSDQWMRDVAPRQSVNHLWMREKEKEDPEWRANELIRVTKIADEDRSVELRELIQSLEARRDAGETLSAFEERRIEVSKAELQHYAEKWAGEGWKPTREMLEYGMRFEEDAAKAKAEMEYWAEFPKSYQPMLYRLGRQLDRVTSIKDARD